MIYEVNIPGFFNFPRRLGSTLRMWLLIMQTMETNSFLFAEMYPLENSRDQKILGGQ